MLVQGHATHATNGLHNDGGVIFTLGFANSQCTRAAVRVPAVYVKLAFWPFSAFLQFRLQGSNPSRSTTNPNSGTDMQLVIGYG